MASQMTTTNQTQSCSSYQTVGSRLCTTYQDKTVGPVHSVKSQRDKNKILVSYLLYNHRYSSVEETRNKCLVLKQKKHLWFKLWWRNQYTCLSLVFCVDINNSKRNRCIRYLWCTFFCRRPMYNQIHIRN